MSISPDAAGRLAGSSIRARWSFDELRLTGYGPFRFADAAGWLLLASAVRVIAIVHFAPAMLFASLLILLAAISATRRIVEAMQGRTALASLALADLFGLARMVLGRLVWPAAALVLLALGLTRVGVDATALARSVLLGVDGIAFDTGQESMAVLVSAATGLVVFMLIVASGTGGDTRLAGVFAGIVRRGRHLGPAFLTVAAMLLIVSHMQGRVRGPAYDLVRSLGTDTPPAAAAFYLFVVVFASLRLSLLIGIYAFFLRRSYMRSR